MDEQTKLRQWAIEQAIALHGVGRTVEVVLGEVDKLLAYVRDDKADRSPPQV